MSASQAAWTEAVVAKMSNLWAEGLSGSQIAARLGMTRCAVLGKAHRYPDQFPPRRKQRTSAPRQDRTREADTKPARRNAGYRNVTKRASKPAPPPEHLGGMGIIVVPMTFAQASAENRCLFFAADPYTEDGPEMPVCGCIRAVGIRKPYCPHHLRAETAGAS